MTYESNKWLEKYEIKGPDYDYLDRAIVLSKDQIKSPERFNRKGDRWESKANPDAPGRFFASKEARKPVRIMFTGDITCFEKQLYEAETEHGYDFDYVFSKVKGIFAQSDLVVGNLETMIVPEAPYRTEVFVCEQTFHCNAPLEFLEAIQRSGMDMVTNANNHDLDTGAVGIGETIDFCEQLGFIQSGTFKTEKPRFEMFKIKGINIAITSFAYYHNYHEDNLTDEGRAFLLSDYSSEMAEKILKEARAAGADVVIVCMHWGKEYTTEHMPAQEERAKELAAMGYDVIIGSHPHVLEDFQVLSVDGKEVPVFYSMGNFVTHHVNNPRARSIIACVDLSKNKGKVKIHCSYIPICVSSSYGDKNYIILPLQKKTKHEKNKGIVGMISDIMGKQIDIDTEADYPDFKQRDEEAAVGDLAKKQRKKLRLKGNKEWPVTYDAGKFVYEIYEDHAEVIAISEGVTAAALTMTNDIAKRPITAIAKGAFQGKGMKKFVFGRKLEFVNDFALKDCVDLEGVFQFTNCLKGIGESAFENCAKLACVVIKSNIKTISKNAFKGCTGLKSVKISKGVEHIAEDAFDGCDQVVFYCSSDSYAAQYAKEHGIKTVEMDL